MNGITSLLIRAAVLVVATVAGAAPAAAQEVVEYIHTDALGSPVAITDASGNVIERSVYEPYGAVVNRPLKDGPGYTGHVTDSDTGLSYMQQRYYDPATASFLSADSVEAIQSPVGGFNRYWYADRNPYGLVDPDGREAQDALKSKIKIDAVPTTDLPAITVSAPKSDARPSPSFFRLKTTEVLRRDTSIPNAIAAGELTRTVTLPALTVTASPPAAGLVGSAAPVVGEASVAAGAAVVRSKRAREGLYYACVALAVCTSGKPPTLQRVQQSERLQQVREGVMRESKAKMKESKNP